MKDFEGMHFLWDLIGNSDLGTMKIEITYCMSSGVGTREWRSVETFNRTVLLSHENRESLEELTSHNVSCLVHVRLYYASWEVDRYIYAASKLNHVTALTKSKVHVGNNLLLVNNANVLQSLSGGQKRGRMHKYVPLCRACQSTLFMI